MGTGTCLQLFEIAVLSLVLGRILPTFSINSFVLRVFLHQISINSFERNKIFKISLSESRNE
jgi:hypothetical protein